jgi:uncharacterized protein YjiS (DUF1127 family)
LRWAHRCSAAIALVNVAVQYYIAVIEFKGAEVIRTASQIERKMQMNIARAYNNWVKYRQTVTELGRMSNRELADLGIARQDIRNVARQAVL